MPVIGQPWTDEKLQSLKHILKTLRPHWGASDDYWSQHSIITSKQAATCISNELAYFITILRFGKSNLFNLENIYSSASTGIGI